MADVWDEREELFGVGDDDSDGSDDEGQGGDKVTKEVLESTNSERIHQL